MMKFTLASLLLGSATAFSPLATTNGRASTSLNAFAFGKKAQAPPPVKKPSFNVDNMPGALAPMGFFDPLGFAAKADEGTLKRYREAEVTHGRVAMLAVLGFLVGFDVVAGRNSGGLVAVS